MRIGFHLTPFWSPTDRSPTRILDEAIEVIAASSDMGFDWVSMGQHWVSHPTVWPQPFPFLARIAPVTGSMQLKTSVLLVPLLNAVELAENVATLDHLCHGRLVVGVAVGYREQELGAVGLTRRDRGPKLSESVQLMKQLWSGEEVTFDGRYTRVEHGRMGFTPFQKPHPPIEFGAQSHAAVARGARLGDGVFVGPQVAWQDVAVLADAYRSERASLGLPVGMLGASRSLMLGTSKEDAASRARQYLEKTFNMYSTWRMQEETMVPLQLDTSIGLDEWTIHGSAADCVETILRARDECGLNGIGFTIYSLPPSPSERIEYLQRIAEEIVAPVKAATRAVAT
ncbi:MAG TPA: LLM class flavin-dependent oxidoreductase [Chloroflexota bacterium]|jgi:alkanesulfonate monooxygenase SsuD/methylene tetrahydromethanopterin reductase-like flavin-dependent oxidoreductase (luciferase family)